MTMVPYCGFPNFEAYWQSGKRFEGVSGNKVVEFWMNIKKPHRRFPKSKGHFP